MQADFWHARWANNQIGFHLDEINPYLMRHLSRLRLQGARRQLEIPRARGVLAERGRLPAGERLKRGAARRPVHFQRSSSTSTARVLRTSWPSRLERAPDQPVPGSGLSSWSLNGISMVNARQS